MSDWTPGQRVIWLHTMHGGYGYIERVPAVIESIGRRIAIRVTLVSGGEVVRYVKPENLRRRS